MYRQVSLSWEAGECQWLQEPSLGPGDPAQSRQGRGSLRFCLPSGLPHCSMGPGRPKARLPPHRLCCSGRSHCLAARTSLSLKCGKFHGGGNLISWSLIYTPALGPQLSLSHHHLSPAQHAHPALQSQTHTHTHRKTSKSVAELTQRAGECRRWSLGRSVLSLCLGVLAWDTGLGLR